MRRLIVLLLIVVAAAVYPARAATVVYYSAPENTFGWCAGYASGRAHTCAAGYCRNTGADCQAVLECDDGWGAIAKAWEPSVGLAASCDFADSFSARTAALLACMSVAQTLCWTSVTFDRNARASSNDANLAFDLTYYIQAMLQFVDYDPGKADGAMGSKTAEAIRQFQRDLEMPETGKADLDVFYRALDAAQGQQVVAKTMVESAFNRQKDGVADLYFATASAPRAPQSFDDELLARTEADRLLALSTILAVNDFDCRPGATAAILTGAFWTITCPTGTVTLALRDGGIFISRN